MRKVFILICFLFIFLFGLTLGGSFNTSASKLFEESIDKFETEIIDPNNNYNGVILVPEENIFNKTANKLEDMIDKIIEKLFSFLS